MAATRAIEKVGTSTGAQPTTAQIIERWQADLDVRPRTKEGYERALRAFVAWLDARGLGIDQVTRADIIAYRDHLAECYNAPTVAAYLVPVRGLFRWAAQVTGTPSIAEGIRGPKTPKTHAKDALTREQARATVGLAEARAEAGDVSALRDAAIYELLMGCGLRTIEAVRADVGDLRTLGGRRVLYVQGKGRDAKDDYVVLPKAVMRAIDRYLSARGNPAADEPLFVGHGNRNHGRRVTTRTVSAICKSTMADAGISSPRLTAHSLRHTAVTAALMGGASIQKAQAMARHARIETTLIYAHNLDRLDSPAEDAVAEWMEA